MAERLGIVPRFLKGPDMLTADGLRMGEVVRVEAIGVTLGMAHAQAQDRITRWFDEQRQTRRCSPAVEP